MNKIKLFYVLLSSFMLIAGLLIYLLFRDLNNMVLFTWIQKPAFFNTVLAPLQPSFFADFLRFHLPDVLWFLSAILFFRFLWFDKIKVQTIYIFCFYGIAIAIEITQLSANIPGTFDWFDLLYMGIGALIEGLLYKLFWQRFFKYDLSGKYGA